MDLGVGELALDLEGGRGDALLLPVVGVLQQPRQLEHGQEEHRRLLVLAADRGVALGVEVGHLDGGAEGAEGAGALAAGRRAEAALEAALLAEPAVEVSRFKFQWVRIRIRNHQEA